MLPWTKLRLKRTTNQSIWKLTRNLTKGPRRPMPPIQENGITPVDPKEKMALLANHLGLQYTVNLVDHSKKEEEVDKIVAAHFQNWQTTKSKRVSNETKRRNAPGHDEISNEVLKKLPQRAIEDLTTVACNLGPPILPEHLESQLWYWFRRKAQKGNCSRPTGPSAYYQ
ncbi:hypothetical protein D910_07509 [Dendroctonus ponderosae]|uniref:Uncharacterized protein n=1 Tax=Dendroctonus ponderosae TaxID=77166 RepID=U4UJI0_DENPD|nr:hypothetical protein D910_07509 [Dendroctonus ponderosae]